MHMLFAVRIILLAYPAFLTDVETEVITQDSGMHGFFNTRKTIDIFERLETLEQKFERENQLRKQEKLEWQKEKEHVKQLSEEMQSQIRSLQHQVKVLENKCAVSASRNSKTSSPPDHSWGKMETRLPELGVVARSDDAGVLEPVINQISQQLNQMEAEMRAVRNTNNQMEQHIHDMGIELVNLNSSNILTAQRVNHLGIGLDAGLNAINQQSKAIQDSATSVFVRWGHSSCPSSSELAYTGVIGGAWYGSSGSSTNVFCLPLNPVLHERAKTSESALMYGAEYQTFDEHEQTDPVCAVCRSPRPTTIMVPATTRCETGWTLEYSGYMMSSSPVYPAGHEAVCMDSSLESRLGSSSNDNGLLFYYMFTICGSLPCPPYENDSIVTCAVCSK